MNFQNEKLIVKNKIPCHVDVCSQGWPSQSEVELHLKTCNGEQPKSSVQIHLDSAPRETKGSVSSEKPLSTLM